LACAWYGSSGCLCGCSLWPGMWFQILSAGPANVEYAVAGAFLLRHIILHGGSLAEALVGTGVQPPSEGSDASGKYVASPWHG
jgi:hypothetical protein